MRPRALSDTSLPLAAIVAAILAIVWWFPQFPTTDGPSHVYNAEIVRQHIVGGGPQVPFFTVSALPLPNWTGHALLVCLLTVFSPPTAERILVSVYFLAWAAALRVYLRATGAASAIGEALGMIFSINLPFMMGFYNFSFGVIGYLVASALIWNGMPRTWPQALVLALVLVFTYFSHPLPLVASLCVIVAVRLVAARAQTADVAKLAAAAAPAATLVAWYFVHTRTSRSAAQFSRQFRPPNGDPLNWHAIQCLWYGSDAQHWIAIAGVVVWTSLLYRVARAGRDRGARPARDVLLIAAMAAAPIVVGVLVPSRFDELFVAARLILLGLVTGLGAIGVAQAPPLRAVAGLAVAAIAVASVLLLADYDRRSNVERASHLAAQEFIGEGRWVAPLVNWRPTFRVDTMSHAEGYFAASANQIDFGNYEGELDYFAVDFRPTVMRPRFYGKPLELADYGDVARKVDALLVWGASPNALAADGACRNAYECSHAQVYLSNTRVPESETQASPRVRCPS